MAPVLHSSGKQINVLVIGAGASGLIAAVAAARQGAAVTLFDRMKKPGRKLLITGNGRCNLTNLDPHLSDSYLLPDAARGPFSSDTASHSNPISHSNPASQQPANIEGIIRSFDSIDTISFFEELGVAAREQDSLVYPRSGQAQSVLNALLFELERLHVKVKYNTEVKALAFSEHSGMWSVKTDGWTYQADRVILSCGSKAAPQTGSNGSGYALAAMAGHSITPVLPALTGLICDTCFPEENRQFSSAKRMNPCVELSLAAGARSKAELSLSLDGQLLAKEQGELQWTDYGVSGIAAFQLSRIAARALRNRNEAFTIGENGLVRFLLPLILSIDLVPDQTEEAVRSSLQRIIDHAGDTISRKQLLGSYVHERVAAFLDTLLSKGSSSSFGQSSRGEQSSPGKQSSSSLRELIPPGSTGLSGEVPLLARLLKAVPLRVTGLRGFDQAQICVGGVCLSEINPKTLESRIAPGLYFAGEMLDVDGPCGGYNLQWAWSSGFAAGVSASR